MLWLICLFTFSKPSSSSSILLSSLCYCDCHHWCYGAGWWPKRLTRNQSSQNNNCCFIELSSGCRRPRVPVCCRVRQQTPSGPRLLPSQAADALGSPSAAESGSRSPWVPVCCRVRQPTPSGLRLLPSQVADTLGSPSAAESGGSPGNPSVAPVWGIIELINPIGRNLFSRICVWVVSITRLDWRSMPSGRENKIIRT